ncbi:MAG: tetratricopeptide repeat protein [Candidatus Promineofilum sp.]|nr:tetratricopeptide repeat protein [Promineifilum sp.]
MRQSGLLPENERRPATRRGGFTEARPGRPRARPRPGASRYGDQPQQPGHAVQAMGDLPAARPYLERALAVRERVLGPEHPDTAAGLNNLGGLLRRWRPAARPTSAPLPSASASSARSMVRRSLNNLVCCGDDRGAALPRARPGRPRARPRPGASRYGDQPQQPGHCCRRWATCRGAALPRARPAVRERVLGPEHPDTATSLNNLGYLLRAMGDLARPASAARPRIRWHRPHNWGPCSGDRRRATERALAVRERVLGPEHPDTAAGLNNLGYLLQDMGDLPAARPYLERALAVWERVLGPEHPDTASSCNNLGVLCYYEGNLPGAAGYMRRALAIWEKSLGAQHSLTQQARDNLAAIEAAIRAS